jgi:hypothetical protein
MSEPRHGTHSLLSLLFDSPLAAFVLCIPVFMATSLLLVGTDLQSFAFWSSREVRLWHMLMAIWPTLFAGTLVAALNDIRRKRFPWPGTRNERTAVVLCTVLGQGLAERLVRQSLDVDADWKQSFEEQRTASTYLGLQGSALQELQQGLTVLAPLLASISSLVLGSGG